MEIFSHLGNGVSLLDHFNHAHHVAGGDTAIWDDVEIQPFSLPQLRERKGGECVCVRERGGGSVCV